MNVLSLFDGMSCGQIALNRAGIEYQNYYASEIDKHAIKVTQHNYPNTQQLGSVTSLLNIDWNVQKIDLLIGGSPCQNFSFAGSQKGMITSENIEVLSLYQYLELKNAGFEFQGQSFLFWEYVRILKEIQQVNPEVKFLLENVKMIKKYQDLISDILGVQPILINSSKFSAQNRPRLYWTNIKIPALPIENKSVIYDILDDNATFNKDYAGWMLNKWGEKTRLDQFFNAKGKSSCLTASMAKGHKASYCVNDNKEIHKFTATECERLQTVPVGYTDVLPNTHRLTLLGNGWTIDAIAHIFKNLKQ